VRVGDDLRVGGQQCVDVGQVLRLGGLSGALVDGHGYSWVVGGVSGSGEECGMPSAGSTCVPASASGPAVEASTVSGTSQSMPSGGRVSTSECGCPWCGSSTASTAPRLPTPEPP